MVSSRIQFLTLITFIKYVDHRAGLLCAYYICPGFSFLQWFQTCHWFVVIVMSEIYGFCNKMVMQLMKCNSIMCVFVFSPPASMAWCSEITMRWALPLHNVTVVVSKWIAVRISAKCLSIFYTHKLGDDILLWNSLYCFFWESQCQPLLLFFMLFKSMSWRAIMNMLFLFKKKTKNFKLFFYFHSYVIRLKKDHIENKKTHK